MQMLCFCMFFLLTVFNTNGQTRKTITLSVKDQEFHVKVDSIFQISCVVENNEDISIAVPIRPVINGYKIYTNFQLGAKIFFINKLKNRLEEIQLDFPTHETTPLTELVNSNKTHLIKAVFLGFGLSKKGKYKVKLYLKYSKGRQLSKQEKFKEVTSQWFYISMQ